MSLEIAALTSVRVWKRRGSTPWGYFARCKKCRSDPT